MLVGDKHISDSLLARIAVLDPGPYNRCYQVRLGLCIARIQFLPSAGLQGLGEGKTWRGRAR